MRPLFAGQVRLRKRRTVHTAPPENAFLKRRSHLPHSRNHATPVVARPNKLLLLQRLQDRPCRNMVELGTRRVAGVGSAYGALQPSGIGLAMVGCASRADSRARS